MPTTTAVIVAFALLATACRANVTGPPEIAVDGTPCSHCGMLVSEPAYAAAYRAAGRPPRVFDDIGCMLHALRREPASPITAWVHDAAGGGWLDADTAIFVSSPHLPTPMSGGILAYADAAAAAHAAEAHRGEVMQSLAELMARNGDGR